MFKQILVPLDGSTLAEQALPVATRLAHASSGSIVLVRVANFPVDYGGGYTQAPLMTEQVIETELDNVDAYLKNVATSEALAGIPVKAESMFGQPLQDILSVVESRRVDLIVICSHGRTGLKRWALGSIAQGLAHQSTVPLLVLREGGQITAVSSGATHGPICALVALDGSPFAETAILPAANLVAQLSAPDEGILHLAHVITHVGDEALQSAKKYIAGVTEQLQQKLRDSNLSITWSLLRDKDIAGTVIDLAEHGDNKTSTDQVHRCDLIAMSTHGRGGLERLMMGSVTERVLHGTKLPMLIVRPQRSAAYGS
ncbi:MAG TPA: universal stress protein [Ktedonobacteraceae bacterium]|nr:universal stress protein [Ktedonobacteraceae bacterium]